MVIIAFYCVRRGENWTCNGKKQAGCRDIVFRKSKGKYGYGIWEKEERDGKF